MEIERAEDADLSRFESFAVKEDLVPVAAPEYGPSARSAARTALVGELRARGLELAEDAEQADLWVGVGVVEESRLEGGDLFVTPGHPHVVHQRTGVRTPVGDVPLGSRTHVTHHPGTLSSTSAHEVTSRTVVVDVVERESGTLVWRGTSKRLRGRRSLDVEDLRRRVRAIAAEYP